MSFRKQNTAGRPPALFYIEPAQKVVPTYVTQLVQGRLERIEQGSRMTASVSLVFDGGYYILVDSPSSADLKAKETMLRCLSAKSINPGEVQLAVTTHGHPDHFGQGNFFPNARHFFGSYEYVDDVYIKTELDANDTMKITSNVELWNTPGHTAQDISVIVSKVPCCGIVAVPYTFPPFTFTPSQGASAFQATTTSSGPIGTPHSVPQLNDVGE
ncbi:hypothetical protein TELCIR_06138 [Teladorsagia circumcincta]|uniref:Metallo-beta-lactamase domain-containing protein n=1 Tax=Teladorsagia circumcincta TaxID=45464 RepID=A0A2G9UNX3_TELCI|nr:hypothetical protein TELCIR_06138 [Teladorsagia circumcincta]